MERHERREEEKVKIEARIMAIFTALDREKYREHQEQARGCPPRQQLGKKETLEMGSSGCQDLLL